MAVPATLLSAAASGSGTAINVTEAAPAGATHFGILKNFTCTVTLTGSPTGVDISLDGSLDNSSWFALGNTTSTSDAMFHVADKPVVWIRGTITTLSGGSTPKATMKCVASA